MGLVGLRETKRENKSASIYYPSWPPRLSPHAPTHPVVYTRAIRPYTHRPYTPTHRIRPACVRALLACGCGRVYAPADTHTEPPTPFRIYQIQPKTAPKLRICGQLTPQIQLAT